MQKKIFFIVSITFAFAFFFSSCVGRKEVENLQLFDVFDGEVLETKSSNFVTSIRERPININIQAINRLMETDNDLERVVELNLFPNVKYIVLFDAPVWRTTTGYTLTGKIVGEPSSEVYLAVNDDIIAISVLSNTGTYVVQFNGTYHEVLQLSEAENADVGEFEETYQNLGYGVSSSYLYHSVEVSEPQTHEKSVIDLFFVITTAAKNGAGGIDNLQNYINLAVTQTNQSFENSMIDLEVQMILLGETNIEPDGYSEALYCITEKTDGCLDEVHAIRDQFFADIVVFVINDDTYCGLSWLMKNHNEYSEQNAFAVVNWRCLSTQYALSREIGKIMGAQTDQEAAPYDEGTFPYSHGYVASDQSFRTIMAMECSGTECPRVNYWSNPSLSLNGQPLGQLDTADNHRTLNEIGPLVSDFRIPPSPPDALLLLAPEDESEYGSYPIMYGWYQNILATQYHIQVKELDTGFVLLDEYLMSSAVCGSSLCTYTPDIVLPGGDYLWQVAGVNSIGEGGFGDGNRFYIPFDGPVTISPNDDATLYSRRPLFQWESVQNATNYDFGLVNRTGSVIVSLNLVAADICQDQVCSYKPVTQLPIGEYYWDIRANKTVKGEWSSQISFTIATLSIPEIVSPTTGFETTDHTPNFDWADHSNADGYYIQISPKSDFSVLPIVFYTTESRYTPGMALINQTYWWRVCAEAGGTISQWSEARTITISGAPGQSPPSLISPEDGSEVTTDQPTFSWTTVSTAERYRIQVSRTPDFKTLFINTLTTTNSYTPGMGMGTGTYYWRVQAIGNGDVSWFTKPRSIIISN